MSRAAWTLCVVLPTLVLTTPLAAQDRPGFWVAAAAGGGIGKCRQFSRVSPTQSIPRCDAQWHPALSGYAALGGAVRGRALLGVEAAGWVSGATDSMVRGPIIRAEADTLFRGDTVVTTARQFGIVSAVALVFPIRTAPFYVKGGLGVGRYAERQSAVLSAVGFGITLGAGAHIRLTRRVTLVPGVQYLYAHGLSAETGSFGLTDPLDFDLLHVAVGVHWQ